MPGWRSPVAKSGAAHIQGGSGYVKISAPEMDIRARPQGRRGRAGDRARLRHLDRRSGGRLLVRRSAAASKPKQPAAAAEYLARGGGAGDPDRHGDRPARSSACGPTCRRSMRCSTPTPMPTTSSGSTTCGPTASSQAGGIPCFGSERTLAGVEQTFSYAFDDQPSEGGGKPRLLPQRIAAGPFRGGRPRVRGDPAPARLGSRCSPTAAAASATPPTATSSPNPASSASWASSS